MSSKVSDSVSEAFKYGFVEVKDGSAAAPLCSFRSSSSRCTKPEKGHREDYSLAREVQSSTLIVTPSTKGEEIKNAKVLIFCGRWNKYIPWVHSY